MKTPIIYIFALLVSYAGISAGQSVYPIPITINGANKTFADPLTFTVAPFTNLVTTSGTGPATWDSGTSTLTIPNLSPSMSLVTRSVGTSPTAFTPSSSQGYRVYYNISISCTATIGSPSSGKVELQYFDTGTTTWTTVQEISNSNTVTLAVVLNSVNTQASVLSFEFPANTQLRLLSTSVGGANTVINYLRGMESLY